MGGFFVDCLGIEAFVQCFDASNKMSVWVGILTGSDEPLTLFNFSYFFQVLRKNISSLLYCASVTKLSQHFFLSLQLLRYHWRISMIAISLRSRCLRRYRNYCRTALLKKTWVGSMREITTFFKVMFVLMSEERSIVMVYRKFLRATSWWRACLIGSRWILIILIVMATIYWMHLRVLRTMHYLTSKSLVWLNLHLLLMEFTTISSKTQLHAEEVGTESNLWSWRERWS